MKAWYLAFLAWFYNPARILAQFEGLAKRLDASAVHHFDGAAVKAEVARALVASSDAQEALAIKARTSADKVRSLFAL